MPLYDDVICLYSVLKTVLQDLLLLIYPITNLSECGNGIDTYIQKRILYLTQ